MNRRPDTDNGFLVRLAATFAPSKGTRVTYAANIGRRLLVLIGAMILLGGSANAASWVLASADTPKTISETELDVLEAKAKGGDWALKKEFAAAYLYEFHYPDIYGCKRLKYGHRCRAMAGRAEVGAIFLHEIVNTSPVEMSDAIPISSFQEHYALTLLRLTAKWSHPDGAYCQDAIRFFELAVQNGNKCPAKHLVDMAKRGYCMPKDEVRARVYEKHLAGQGCPTS